MAYPSDLGIKNAAARGLFQKAFLQYGEKMVYPEFTTVSDSGLKETSYPIQTRVPQLKRGPLEFEGMQNIDFTVTFGDPYRAGLSVAKEVYENDQIGVTKSYMAQLGQRSANLFQKLAFRVLADGDLTTGTGFQNGYDSKPLFSATHVIGGSGNQSNLLDWASIGSGADQISSTADDFETQVKKFQSQFANAKQTLLGYLDAVSEPWYDALAAMDLVITCAPLMEDVIHTAVLADTINATTNVQFKQGKSKVKRVLVSTYLNADSAGTSTTGEWHLHVAGGAMKSVLNQRYKQITPGQIKDPLGQIAGGPAIGPSLNAVELMSIVRTGAQVDSYTLINDEFLFAARVRTEAVPGMWQACVLNKAAMT